MVDRYDGIDKDPDGAFVYFQDYAELEAICEGLDSYAAVCVANVQRLETELAAANERIKVLEAERDRLKGECQNALDYMVTLSATITKQSSEIEELRARHAALKLENEVLESMSRHVPSPCGHSSQYAYTEDGGKHIVCLLCSRARHEALVEAAREHYLYHKGELPADRYVPNSYIKIHNELKAALVEVK